MKKENKDPKRERDVKIMSFADEAQFQIAIAIGFEKSSLASLENRAAKLSQFFNNNKDALYVATSDPSELETVRKNYVVRKMNIEDKEYGVKLINKVARMMKGIKKKNRAAFYELLDVTHSLHQSEEVSLDNEDDDSWPT